jgi:hypothetical protein
VVCEICSGSLFVRQVEKPVKFSGIERFRGDILFYMSTIYLSTHAFSN